MTEPHRNGNGQLKHKDISSICEDWIFLVEDHAGVLARCCDPGLTVDLWSNAGQIKDKKAILVFPHVGDHKKDQFEVLGIARAAKPALLRVWTPFGLGDEQTPDLKALGSRYSLAELLFWDKPWEYDAPPAPPEKRTGWPCTDYGNAERMASRYGAVIRFCHPWKKWLVWNGQRWGTDDVGKVDVLAKQTIRRILDEAAGAFDTEERKALASWAVKCETAGRVTSLMKLVRTEFKIPILPSFLDPDPWLFNCPNGTVNLKSGRMREHDRSDMITRMSPVEFDIEAECPLWESTIDRIFNSDEDLISFVQRLFGICLTGDVSEQILPIFFGEGGNGKSTILNALLDIMGPDYAIAAPPGLLFTTKGDKHPTDKASLFGMRLVVDMESAESARLNEAVVKQLTGSDRISARRMREDFWTFNPTHKLIIGTNNQPAIQETKNAIWRRLKLVPFTVEIPESEQDGSLPEKLRAEYPGILAWCSRGCVDWVQGGLRTPSVVKAATAEYRAEEDALGSFIEDECITDSSVRCRASQLYQRYRKGLEGFGMVNLTQTAFGRAMAKRGFEKHSSNGIWYLGIALRQKEESEEHASY